jgi:ArsR family transcriptional regulator
MLFPNLSPLFGRLLYFIVTLQYINLPMGLVKSDLFTEEQNELALVCKVLGHPARIAILQYLARTDQCITGQIVDEIGLAQPTISQHLRELKAIGIVQGTIEGTSVCYCINKQKWEELGEFINSLFKDHHPDIKCC